MTVSSINVPSGYQLTGSTSYGLAAGGVQTHSLYCSPTAVGQMNGNLVVNSDDPVTPSVSIPVSCRGIDSAVAISPSPTTITTTRVEDVHGSEYGHVFVVALCA